MAPTKDITKVTPKVQRSISKSNTKGKASPVSKFKKAMSAKNNIEKVHFRVDITNTVESKQSVNPAPEAATPKAKENKSTLAAKTPSKNAQLTESAKKRMKIPTWQRRPKPAHSGVPVPEKMRKLMERQLNNPDCIF